MPNYIQTVSGKFPLTAPLANNASVSVPFPAGTGRSNWAVVDVLSAQIALGQSVFSYPKVEIAVGTTLTITNKSGAAFEAGPATISAKVPDIPISRIEQANYEALPAADANRLYLIPEA